MEIQKGPGIVKVNTEILSDDLKKGQIGEELDFLIKQIPKHWNGHTKLEYVKMSIRSVLAKYVSISRSEDKLELEKLETSLNDIEKLSRK
jgi:septum formation topological specificity factor MinE